MELAYRGNKSENLKYKTGEEVYLPDSNGFTGRIVKICSWHGDNCYIVKALDTGGVFLCHEDRLRGKKR